MARYASQAISTVLFEPWPNAAGHRLYALTDLPDGPEEMFDNIHQHYVAMADRLGAGLAPVGLAWTIAIEAGIDLYSRDGHHSRPAGAWLAAMMLASQLGIPSPYSARPPERVDAGLTQELVAIARRVGDAREPPCL